MGKYFAFSQGFEEDVCHAINEHYLPISISSPVPKKLVSYALSIIDKLDTLVGFYLINENQPVLKILLHLEEQLLVY